MATQQQNININVNTSQVTSATSSLGGLQSALGSTQSAAGGTSSSFSAMNLAAGAVGVGIGLVVTAAAAAGTALIGLATSAIESADGLRDLSGQTNISVERLSVMTEAYKTTGISINEVIASSETLSQKLAKQDEMTGKVAMAVQNLGVKMEDENGIRKTALQLQEDIIVAADESVNKQEAEANAVMALGTSYYKLRAGVLDVKESKSELYDLMARTGAITTKELANASDNLNDKLTNMKTVFGGIGNSIATMALPMLTKLAQVALETAEAVARAIAKIAGTNPISEQTADALSGLTSQRDALSASIDKVSKSEYANTAAGTKALAVDKEKLSVVQDQIREMTRYKAAAEVKVAADKKIALAGAPGEGISTASGKAPKVEKEKKEKKAPAEDKSFERMMAKINADTKAANAEEENGTQKVSAAMREKIKLQEDFTAGLLKITPEEKKQLDGALDMLSVLQDQAEGQKKIEEINKRKNQEADQNAKRQEQQWASQADNMRAYIDQNYDVIKQLQIVDDLEKNGKITVEEATEARRKYNNDIIDTANTFSAGWDNALKKFTIDSQDAAKQGSDAFASFQNSIESSLNRFIETGKFSFSDFARSIIIDMGKMAAKAASSGIMQLLGGGGSSGGGGWGGLFSSIVGAFGGGSTAGAGASIGTDDLNSSFTGRALGGPAYGTTMVGENGPELIHALTPSKVTPNNKMGGDTYSISINVTGTDKPEQNAEAINAQLMKTMQGIARGEIQSATRRGNALNPL